MTTNKEQAWWRRFRKCLNDMPDSLEILVSAAGAISAAERRACKKYFDEHGDVDNVPVHCELSSWSGKGVENNASSL